MASRLRTAIAAFGLLASSHAAHALDPGREPSQYVIRKSYIRDHSEANVSHGICPDRMAKL